jgi:hypothetical protein
MRDLLARTGYGPSVAPGSACLDRERYIPNLARRSLSGCSR